MKLLATSRKHDKSNKVIKKQINNSTQMSWKWLFNCFNILCQFTEIIQKNISKLLKNKLKKKKEKYSKEK